MPGNAEEIERLIGEVAELETILAKKKQRLAALQAARQYGNESLASEVTRYSSPEEKIRLFRALFCGREDVYAVRFVSITSGKSGYRPACKNEWVPGVCRKPKIKCAECQNRSLYPSFR